MNGTPKTVKQSVLDAFEAYGTAVKYDPKADICDFVEERFRDYCAQKFTPDLMAIPEVQELWKRLFPSKPTPLASVKESV